MVVWDPLQYEPSFTNSSALLSCATIKEKLPGSFSPVQFGVDNSIGGAENVVHGVRNLLSDHPDWVLVSLDLVNAFNSVSRPAFFMQVEENFPNILPWVWQRYGQTTLPSADKRGRTYPLSIWCEARRPHGIISCSALPSNHPWRKSTPKCSPSPTWMTSAL